MAHGKPPPYDGQALQTHRVSAGLSIRQFAVLCGVSDSQLSKIETGKSRPRPSTRKKIDAGLARLRSSTTAAA